MSQDKRALLDTAVLISSSFPRSPRPGTRGILKVSRRKNEIVFIPYRGSKALTPYIINGAEKDRKVHAMKRGPFIYVKAVTAGQSLRESPMYEAFFKIPPDD